MEADDAVFDRVMQTVGDNGAFQKRFNYIFNIGMVFFSSMVYMNIILALNVPDFWCNVPGREFTNFTELEWREITIPRDGANVGTTGRSNCQVYNISNAELQQKDYQAWNFTDRNVIACKTGFSFDKKWYEETIVSQEHWVCDKDLYVTNTFVFNRIGEMLGTFVFGQLGDLLGRQKIYYVSLVSIVGGRIMSILTTSHYFWFAVANVLGSISANSIFQAPLLIAMETTRGERRAKIAMLQSLSWTMAMCAMPLVFWWVRHWSIFMTVTTLPVIVFFFFPKYMIESPRWLVSKNRYEEAAKHLKRIAEINGNNHIDLNEKWLTNIMPKSKVEQTYGMASLFSGWRIARNTILLVTCWIICSVSYFTLVLFITRMDGNPFVNFLWQSAVEAPAYILGERLGDTLGRRFTNVGSSLLSAFICIPLIMIVKDSDMALYSTLITVFLKFLVSISFYMVNLQSMESYPTCLRHSGISIGTIVANGFGVVGPYIVYLGTNHDARYPYMILGVLFIIASVCGLLLPETLHKKLPDTLEEARTFGENQKFWSLPRKPSTYEAAPSAEMMTIHKSGNKEKEDEATHNLNQPQFAP